MTRGEVIRKIHALTALRDSCGTTEAPLTVGQWLDHWLTGVAANRVRPRTLESYRSIVELHAKPIIGAIPLAALEPEALEQLYLHLGDTLSAATVLRVHRVLARALKVAHQRQRTHRDVSRLVDPPRQDARYEANPLTIEEAHRVLLAASAGDHEARWSVALTLGLRQSEALALKWADLNLDDGTLSVRRTLHRVTGEGLVFDEPKTARSRRTVALPTMVVIALRKHRHRQHTQRRAAAGWKDNDLVFPAADGRPMDKTADYDGWCRLLALAGVRHHRLHDARHTAATIMLHEGVHPRVVMEILGHSQMRTTTDTYSHVVPDLMHDAARRIGSALSGPQSG